MRLSFFTSALDNQPKPLDTTWEDLAGSLRDPRQAACTPETCKRSECAEKHGNAWSPASYPPNAHRARGSVAEVSLLVLDIDHVPSDDELVAVLDRIPYQRIVHASHSDRPGDRCVRVVVRLSEPVAGAQWPAFWAAAIKGLGVPVDQATKDASRLYFLPSRPTGATTTEFGDGTDYLYAFADGPPLDVQRVLESSVAAEVSHVGPTPTSHVQESSHVQENGRARAVALLAERWPSQGRHQASLALAGALAHANYDQHQIAEFLNDVMDIVYGPGKDPTPRKRHDQALTSYNKRQQGEPVSGWPSLIPHVTEQTVAEVTKLLGISNKPGPLLQALIDKHAGPQRPTQDELVTHYKTTRARLLKQRTNLDSQREARALQRMLQREQPAESDEDPTAALVLTLRTLVKYIPDLATHDQLAQLLVHVFPINIGQDANRPWGDVLTELLDQCAEALAQEAAQGLEFEMETGGQRQGKVKNILTNIDVALKKLNVRFKFDEFARKKLVSFDNAPFAVVEDEHVDRVWFELETRWEFDFGYEKFSKYLNKTAMDNRYHPVRDYLDTLEWDGVARIGSWLHAYGGAKDTEYTRAISRLVLIAAVRRVREPGCKFDEMLIMEGEQGVAKSSALAALCPDRTWFSDDLPLSADSKRVIESTSGKWIVEAGELRDMNKKAVGDLKGFLSRCIDEARMAFGREVRIAPRQFIIIGTTNDAQYLRDPTGLRRFWPVWVEAFDLASLARDRDQLWAEAAYYESQGESIRLDPKYYALATEEQEERRVVDAIEAILTDALTGHTGKLKVTDVYMLLGKDAADARPDEETRVGHAMRRAGWKHTRRRIAGKLTYVYVKGADDTLLGVSGRKVVKAQDVASPVPIPQQKAN